MFFCNSGSRKPNIRRIKLLWQTNFSNTEPNQHEQYVNGFFLEKMGKGICIFNDLLSEKVVSEFLNTYTCSEEIGVNGVHKAIKEIRKMIDEKS
jgi:hypothetical protein